MMKARTMVLFIASLCLVLASFLPAAAHDCQALAIAGTLPPLETALKEAHLFGWAWKLFACATITLWLTTRRGRATGYAAAWVLVSSGVALMVGGFTLRAIVAGRAPVTNMYESILCAAFGTVFFAMILEAIHRSRTLFLSALPVAVAALILADTQPAILDASIRPLAPVLRNNFWLIVHVVTITLGYAALALAMGMGHIALLKTLLRRPITAAFTRHLTASLQIGVLFLALGTVLGAMWAHYAWGRFWGWDPKETWALITLLCYLALLHGRLADWWRGFGLAVGSILAFQAVLMTWYGVNFVLGTGLHSYGFGTGGFGYAVAYVTAEAVFVVVALARKPAEIPVRARLPELTEQDQRR